MDQINERKKLIDEYEKSILPTLIVQSQEIKENCQMIVDKGKEISEEMEDFTDITKTKLRALDNHREIILKSDELVWTSFLTGLNRDRSLQGSLDQLNSELNHQVAFPLAMMAASTISMIDASGNVCNTIFTIVANEKQLPKENISLQYYNKSNLDNKNTVRLGLAKLLPSYLHEFNDIIRDWESKNFRDMKCLIGLRTVIFEKLFGLKSEKGIYNDTIWHKNEVFKNYIADGAGNDYYNKVLYFILGENDPSKYPPSLINQMVETANNLSILQDKLSKFGKIRKQKTSNLEIELIFQDTLSYTSTAFKIRNAIRKS